MTPNKRGRRPANVREMPPPNEGHTPEIPQTLAPESSETASSAPARGLPAPKKFDLPPEELFRYYRPLDDAFPGRLVLYGYRTLPVTDVTQPLSEDELRLIQQKKKKEPPKNICIEKACPVKEPADWNRWACETFGAGDYHFKLNDQHPSVKKTIAMTTTKGEGSLRDWNSFPPVLHCNEAGEVDQVVLNDPLNESYVRWAKLNGIKFPGDTDSRQATREDEETEMASVVDTMARQVEGLTNKVVSMAEKQSAASAANAPTDPAAKGELAGIANANRGAEIGMDFIAKSFGKIIENQAKAADPTEHLKGVVEVAKLLQPPAGNGNSDLLKIMELQIAQQREQAKQQLDQQDKSFTRLIESERESHKAIVQMLTSRLDSLEKQKSEAPASSEENALKTYQRIRAIVRDLEEEEAPANDGPAWLGPVLSLGEKAISGIAETTRNLAAMRNNQSPMATVQDPAQGLPPAPPPPETPQDKEMNMQREYAKMVHRPLVDAIKAGRMGYEFAAGLISEAGQPAYDALVANGYDGLTRFLQGYPPLWNELTLPPIGGVATDKFLREFLDRAKVMDAMQMVKGQPVRKGPTINQ